jgi:glucan-binding YG repeat protein
MKKKGIKLFSLLISTMVFICNISFVKAEETSAYAYSDSATSNGVILKVEWNEPVLGEPTTFHVSATGGSGIYKFNMEAPSYTNPDELAYESVADPSRGEWTKYTSECESQDYTFTMMATGTYNFRFHVMDIKAGVTYLRTNTYIQVSSPNYPSVNSIVQNAVVKCNSETNGSDYSKALWLHDWLLEQLDYDNSLKWSSAESALTRNTGTCQAYERAYAKLLSVAGIENAETRDTYDGHTWNAMKLDGKWYQVDCTWDDSSENYYNFNRKHLYFALSDELMAIAHQGHNNIYTVEGYATPSNSLEHNYFVQNGDAQQWVESYRNRIQENLNNKNTEFSIQADNSTYPPSIYGIQNGIIAYVMNQNKWFVNGKKVELVAKTNDKQFDFIVTYPVVCTNHDWDEGVITTEPTCTTSGIKTYTCNNCKTTKIEEVDTLGHNYSKEWTIDREATCTQEGSKSHHCTRCDSKVDTTVIPKTSHNFDNGVITTAPTCTKDGVKTYTCKDCKTTKIEVINALGHDYSSDWTIDKKATCTESGSKSHHCTRCDSKIDVTVIPKLAHNYDNGVITTSPTCTKSGVKTFTCKDCKTTKTEELKALGHDYSKEWTIDKKATCKESGSKSHHCARCDSKSDVTVISKLSHDWVLTSTVNPTRDHEGKKVYTCNLCKETKEESIPKLVGKWVSNSVGKWYEYSDGTYENSGFKKIENETYYFTSNGYAKTGWLSVNNNWYFFKNSGCMVTSNWAGSYYLDSDGKMKTNSFTPDGYYCGADGVYVRNAWIKYNGNYYYVNANGLMKKNAWVKDYYLGDDGVMKTNTFTPDGYYVGSDGAYYRNRWIKYENKYYYTNSVGLIVKNAWIGAYYLGSDGVMMINSFTPDGYYVGADGAYLRNQKIQVDGKEYYLNAAGKVARNQWVGDYYLNGAGSIVKNHWAGNYWCGADGRYVKSSWVDDGRYYVGPNGVYVTNQWIGDYYLNGAGLVTKNAWVGNYWCGSDGKYVKSSWVDNNQYYVGANGVYVPGRWGKYDNGWCYYAGSVYAKDITLNIGGKAYTFDSNGYMK